MRLTVFTVSFARFLCVSAGTRRCSVQHVGGAAAASIRCSSKLCVVRACVGEEVGWNMTSDLTRPPSLQLLPNFSFSAVRNLRQLSCSLIWRSVKPVMGGSTSHDDWLVKRLTWENENLHISSSLDAHWVCFSSVPSLLGHLLLV